MPFDLPAQFVDIAAGASYKWLCAPEGCGLFYLSERARGQIRPPSFGWTCYENPWDFGDRDQPILSSAQIWETGMGGTALLCGLEASLNLLQKQGLDKIQRYLEELTDFLCEIVPADRYAIVSSRAHCEKSQIVCLKPLAGHSAETIVTKLKDQQICVSSRAGSIRVAPHFFNTCDDLEMFVEALP